MDFRSSSEISWNRLSCCSGVRSELTRDAETSKPTISEKSPESQQTVMGQCIGKPSLAPDIQRTRVSTLSSDKSLRDSGTMETGSPRKIQFTVPLLDTHLSHLDPEAAEQIRRRRPTPATLVASSDQSSPEIDEDRLPNQLYKAALLNSPRQRRKGQKGTPTMKELQFMVEHHLYKQQQQGAGGGDEVSSESCLSDRHSPDTVPAVDELPHDDDDDEEDTAEAFEKLRCQMEEFSRESLLEGGLECPLSKEEVGCSNLPVVAESSSQPKSTRADTTVAVATVAVATVAVATVAVATASSASQTQGEALWSADGEIDKSSGRHNAAQSEPAKCSD